MNITICQKAKILIAIFSSFGLAIIELLKSKYAKNPKYFFSKLVRSFSPKTLKRLNTQNINTFNYDGVIVTGRIKSLDYKRGFFMRNQADLNIYNLKNHKKITAMHQFSETFPYYNLRLNYPEKRRMWIDKPYNLLNTIISPFISFKNEKEIANYYFLYDDMITIYGRVGKNYDLDKNFIIPEMVVQGNKQTLNYLYKKKFSSLEHLKKIFEFSLFFTIFYFIYETVCQEFGMVKKAEDLELEKFLKLKKDANSRNNLQNCQRCNTYYKNIVFLNCNHFVLCLKCYIETNKTCPLCHIRVNEDNIKIIKDF
jgi:hypothetical protein